MGVWCWDRGCGHYARCHIVRCPDAGSFSFSREGMDGLLVLVGNLPVVGALLEVVDMLTVEGAVPPCQPPPDGQKPSAEFRELIGSRLLTPIWEASCFCMC